MLELISLYSASSFK